MTSRLQRGLHRGLHRVEIPLSLLVLLVAAGVCIMESRHPTAAAARLPDGQDGRCPDYSDALALALAGLAIYVGIPALRQSLSGSSRPRRSRGGKLMRL